MHAILRVLDDLASEQKFHRNYGPISELYTRGRHFLFKPLIWIRYNKKEIDWNENRNNDNFDFFDRFQSIFD